MSHNNDWGRLTALVKATSDCGVGVAEAGVVGGGVLVKSGVF